MKQEPNRTAEAKAFCYDNGLKTEDMDEMWKALYNEIRLVKQLTNSGCDWRDLNSSCMADLVKRYKAFKNKESEGDNETA